jgi:ATP synthase protein I
MPRVPSNDSPPARGDKSKEEKDNVNPKDNFLIQAARYSHLALVLPAAVVVGWFVGSALDRWLHTTWLYLLGILLGIAAGFIELIRSVLRDTK